MRYGVMVALQILALSVRVRILLSQLFEARALAKIRPCFIIKSAIIGACPKLQRPQGIVGGRAPSNNGGVAQLVRASDS